MEFIELAGFILQFSYPYAKTVYGFSIPAYIALIVAGGIFLALHACKAAALFIMAKKQGKKKLLWCAFLPFANTFLIGELGGEVKFGNLRLKHVGIVAMLAELVFVACRGFVLGYYAYAFHNGLTYFEVENNMIGWGFNEGVLTDGMYTALNACEIAGYILSFVVIIAFIFVNIGIFRKYAPDSYIWMVVLCALLPPVEGILLLVFARRTPVDYEKYMRERIEAIRRRQAQYGPYGPYGPYGQNPYGQNQNPYGQNQNPYGQPQQGSAQGNEAPPDPFGEFSDQKGQGSQNGGGQSQNGGSGQNQNGNGQNQNGNGQNQNGNGQNGSDADDFFS